MRLVIKLTPNGVESTPAETSDMLEAKGTGSGWTASCT